MCYSTCVCNVLLLVVSNCRLFEALCNATVLCYSTCLVDATLCENILRYLWIVISLAAFPVVSIYFVVRLRSLNSIHIINYR